MITEEIVYKLVGKNPDYQNSMVRTKLGSGAGIVGIVSNLLLTLVKAGIGYVSGSISIIADALNNLTDMASAIVSVVGIRLSGKASDKEHPYGHGRGEYVATLIVAFVIFFVGLSLLKSSVEAIISPRLVKFSWPSFLVLLVSILVKYWMYTFYKKVALKIDSSPLRASAIDSLGDVLVTSIVVISFVASKFTSLPIDGIGGVLVSLFILKSGYDLIVEMTSELLGLGPSIELEEDIEAIFKAYPEIIGTHDLCIHYYGHHSKYATIDAVVASTEELSRVHEIFTEIEHNILDQYGLMLTIHMDVDKSETEKEKTLRDKLDQYLEISNNVISYHDDDIIEDEAIDHVMIHLVTDGKKVVTNEDIQKEKEKLCDYLIDEFGKCDYDIIIDKKYD